MTDPIADIIGDYRAFTALQRDRLAARAIDIAPYELGHLAVRVPEWEYAQAYLRSIRQLAPFLAPAIPGHVEAPARHWLTARCVCRP